jgi:hypothetical protein
LSVIERVDHQVSKAQEAMAMECRATRHWMARQSSPPADWEPPLGLFRGARYVLHFECARCGTWRHVAIDHVGTMLASRYDWPDWYRRQGEGRPSGEELRLWQVKQLKRGKGGRP